MVDLDEALNTIQTVNATPSEIRYFWTLREGSFSRKPRFRKGG